MIVLCKFSQYLRTKQKQMSQKDINETFLGHKSNARKHGYYYFFVLLQKNKNLSFKNQE